MDDTLYPKGTGPFPHVNRRIDDYVMARCSLGIDEAKELRRRYIRSYGSTLGGLMKHYGVDPDHYLKAVHDVPVEDLLKQDLQLKRTLSGIENEMVAHAARLDLFSDKLSSFGFLVLGIVLHARTLALVSRFGMIK